MKNELYSFETVKTPGFDLLPASSPCRFGWVGRVAPRAPFRYAKMGRAPAPRNPRNFGFFGYFRFFHLHIKTCKIARFFVCFSTGMYTIPHIMPKYGSLVLIPSFRRLCASTSHFPLNTQNVQKSPYSRMFCDPNAPIPTPFPLDWHYAPIAHIRPTPPNGGSAPALFGHFSCQTHAILPTIVKKAFLIEPMRKHRITAIPAFYHNSHSTGKIRKNPRITAHFTIEMCTFPTPFPTDAFPPVPVRKHPRFPLFSLFPLSTKKVKNRVSLVDTNNGIPVPGIPTMRPWPKLPRASQRSPCGSTASGDSPVHPPRFNLN